MFFVLFLIVAPKVLPFSFGTEPQYLGESTTVQCSISTGDMPLKFMWMLNGKPLRNIQGVNIGSFGKKSSVISIDSLDEHHAGNYTCIVKNKAGVSSFRSELIVKGTSMPNCYKC